MRISSKDLTFNLKAYPLYFSHYGVNWQACVLYYWSIKPEGHKPAITRPQENHAH